MSNPTVVRKREDSCIWLEDSDGTWDTSCGVSWTFISGDPAENQTYFCHHCGGEILADGFEGVDE